MLAVVALLAAASVGAIEASDNEPIDAGASTPVAQELSGSAEANLPFLFAVFIITWGAFFGYAFYVSRRQRETQREIEALKRALDQRERSEAETESEEQQD